MAYFCSLYSSSSGNSTFVGSHDGGILIDVGVSCKKEEQALSNIGIAPKNIKAIFVTHEHSDHIKGIRLFASKYKIPVYASNGTLIGMDEQKVFTSPINAFILPDSGINVGDMFVKPFKTSHDSYCSQGFTVSHNDGKKACVCTDLGTVTDNVVTAAEGSDIILLESNHDKTMLQMGPYPPFLKHRILSNTGHLSNEACSEFAVKLLQSGTKNFILGHLSKENNIPRLAHITTESAFCTLGAKKEHDFHLTVAGDLNAPVEY